MHRLKLSLIIWFVCGVFGLIINAANGEHLQWANGTTGVQSIRTRDRQQQQHHQSQYQYALSKPANKQQPNRGRNGLNELRKNLTAQKQSERQGDDPYQNSVNLSPIHQIHQKIQQSDVSKIELNNTTFAYAEQQSSLLSFNFNGVFLCVCVCVCI